MSILQDYAKIRQNIGEVVFQRIEKFLEEHTDLLLSDVYYKKEIWEKFMVWEKENYPDPQAIIEEDKTHDGLPF